MSHILYQDTEEEALSEVWQSAHLARMASPPLHFLKDEVVLKYSDSMLVMLSNI